MIRLLRGVLLALLAILVVLQTLSFPGQFRYLAEEHPDLAWLRWPLTAVAVLTIGCLELVVVSTWKLLGLVSADRIFSERAFVWVDAIVGAVAAAWVVLLGAFLWVGSAADDPGPVIMMLLLVVAGAAFALLLVVMRALLHQATQLRTELETVI